MSDVFLRGVNMEYIDYLQEHHEKSECGNEVCVDFCVSIQRAINYVDKHFTEQITLGEMCKVAMMSQSAFINSFKRIAGKTLIEYIHFLRVELAKELLQKTNLNITSVSEKCGFGDSTYFGKVFKKYTGMTPKQYKASGNKE